MAWQYRVTDLDMPTRVTPTMDDLEHAEKALRLQRLGYPWPDRLVIQKRHVGDWEPLEPSTLYWEDAITEGPRKAWDDADEPPAPNVEWELDYSKGRPGLAWDRFYYTEERYWRRWIGPEGEHPADELTPYVAANGERLTIEEARVTRKIEYFPIVWSPKNPKLR
jgi:hypothetical protein